MKALDGKKSEQQRLRTWIVFLLRISSYLVGSLVGRVVLFLDFLADPTVLLCCNALQVLC